MMNRSLAMDIDDELRDSERFMKEIGSADIETIRYVIETQGLDVTTIFRSVIRSAKIDVLNCLVELGADINADNGHVLTTAILTNRMDVVDYLFEKKIDLSVAGGSALSTAILTDRTNVVHHLLAEGIDLSIIGGRALRSAIAKSNIRLINLLLSHGAIPTEAELHTAVRHDNKEIVSMLLNIGIMPHDETLKVALLARRYEIIALMVDRGAWIEEYDSDPWCQRYRETYIDQITNIVTQWAKSEPELQIVSRILWPNCIEPYL